MATTQQLISQAATTRAQYDLAFQVSPIILQGGIAASAQGGLLPIIALYNQLAQFDSGTSNANAFLARYVPLPGSTLIANAVGMYPFANQQVAANAIIQQPLTLSLLMICPVNQPGGYLSKLPFLTGLQNALQQHNLVGGTYSVATPAYIYNSLLMTGMTDVTHGDGNQQQVEYQIDFVQPLVTTQQAAVAQSALMQRVTNGQQIVGTPAWSGTTSAVNPSLVTGMTGALATFGGATSPLVSNATGVSGGSS